MFAASTNIGSFCGGSRPRCSRRSDDVAVRALFTPALRSAFVEVGACHLECVSSTLMFRELEQTTVRDYELFVDDSLKLYRACLSSASAAGISSR